MKLTSRAVTPARIACSILFLLIVLVICGPIATYSPRWAMVALGVGFTVSTLVLIPKCIK